jgi:hypothetical protein
VTNSAARPQQKSSGQMSAEKRRIQKSGFPLWWCNFDGRHLLPIIPPDAHLSPKTGVAPNNRGKTPGRLTSGGWIGLTGSWPKELYAELADVQRWHGWKASVGLQTRAYPAIDIDVDDEATAAAIEGEFKRIFGAAPVRFREGSSRRLMLTRIADGEMSFRKRRGHDEYVQAVRGLKASFGPRREEFKDEVLEWSPGVRSTEDDQFEIRWNSIRDSALGWSWVAAQARKYGFTEDAQTDFDDELPKEWIGENNTAPKAEPTKTPCIIAKLYTWTDPCTIAPRPWVYDRHFIRNFLSGTFAPGGLGKSSLLIAEALAMATGKNLLGVLPKTQLRVWYWNGEDPWDELQRRIAAACSHYHVNATDLGDRLFVSSGRDTEIVIAYDDRGGTRVATPVVEALCTEIRAKRIDVLILDPFVALHGVSENDNNKINAVCRHFAMVAEKTGCAIELVHHVRKRAPDQGEYSVDDARGASALLAAMRSARTLNPMTKEEAARAGVEKPYHYFRVNNGKANLAPPSDQSTWRRLVSVQLGNGETIPHAGDSVGWPDPAEDVMPGDIKAIQDKVAGGERRESAQAKAWVGNAVADALGLDLTEPATRARVKALVKTWLQEGVLKLVKGKDAKRVARVFVEVGRRVAG